MVVVGVYCIVYSVKTITALALLADQIRAEPSRAEELEPSFSITIPLVSIVHSIK